MWSGAWLWFGFISLMANETEYLSMYSLANFKKCLLKYLPIFKLHYLFFFYYWVLIFCYLLYDFHIFSPVFLEFYRLSLPFFCLFAVSVMFFEAQFFIFDVVQFVLFICLWLCWVFIAVQASSLAAAGRGFSQVCHPHCGELSCCGAQNPGHTGCSSFGTWLCSRGSQALQHKLRNYSARA